MVKNLQVNFDKNFKFQKELIHRLILFLKKELDCELISLVVNFVNASYMLEINRKYLNHNFETDIITFNYSGDNKNLDGEIFISYEEAVLNARKFGVSENDEYFRLVIHGFLHLMDYDDQDKKDKKEMKRKENSLLKKFTSQHYRIRKI